MKPIDSGEFVLHARKRLCVHNISISLNICKLCILISTTVCAAPVPCCSVGWRRWSRSPFFWPLFDRRRSFFGMNAGKMMSRQRMGFFSGFHWFHCCCSLILRQVWVETTSCCHSRIWLFGNQSFPFLLISLQIHWNLTVSMEQSSRYNPIIVPLYQLYPKKT